MKKIKILSLIMVIMLTFIALPSTQVFAKKKPSGSDPTKTLTPTPTSTTAPPAGSTSDIVCKSIDQFDSSCSSGQDRIVGSGGLITNIVQVMVFLIGAISVLVIVIAGFRYVVSGGSPDSTKGAKDMIIYAIIGLVVALLAQAIVSFVLARL